MSKSCLVIREQYVDYALKIISQDPFMFAEFDLLVFLISDITKIQPILNRWCSEYLFPQQPIYPMIHDLSIWELSRHYKVNFLCKPGDRPFKSLLN